jgi:hypothetical protein
VGLLVKPMAAPDAQDDPAGQEAGSTPRSLVRLYPPSSWLPGDLNTVLRGFNSARFLLRQRAVLSWRRASYGWTATRSGYASAPYALSRAVRSVRIMRLHASRSRETN